MRPQIGIELSPGACRIVDIDVRRIKTGLRTTRVRRFSVLQPGSAEMTAALEALRGRAAAVVVWGVPGDHRQVMVTEGTYDSMRREASRALTLAGIETRGALVDIARVPASSAREPGRRPVVVALANGAAVSAAIQPLRAAGIEVKWIATPATALASLSRVRRMFGQADADPSRSLARLITVVAYVAIEEFATCITLLRDGTLVAARELSWGFVEGRRELRRRQDIATRFGEEFAEFMTTVGGSLQSVRQVMLCGGALDLRGLAGELTARFGIAVEALDQPAGIDAARDAETIANCADMWMALAVAADQPAPLSLLHSRQLQAAHARLARAAIAAGIVVGVGVAWETARCAFRADSARAIHRTVPARSADPHAGFR